MKYLHILKTIFVFLLLNAPLMAQENWPQWRGPEMNGTSPAKGLPVSWSTTENIIWKTALPSWSGSTPAIWGDTIFLISPSAADPESIKQNKEQQAKKKSNRRRRRGGPARHPGGQDLLLLAISTKDGSIIWQKKMDEGNRIWRKHNNTSPSPVTNGKGVWAVTGTGVVSKHAMDGTLKWQHDLQKEYGEFGINWGYAASPRLYKNMLIVAVLHGYKTDDPSYILAFDIETGNVLWRQERPTDARVESPDAYTTPAILEHDGQTQIVITGGDYVTGHALKTGAELWRAGGLNPDKKRFFRIVASPVISGDMIYAPTRKKPLLALRAGGSGDISKSHLVWKWEGPAATDVPTPICDGTNFYMVDDKGFVICLDAKTGTVIWGPERTEKGTVSASPVLADNKIYITNEKGTTTVLAAGPKFKHIATNELDGSYTLSSPAIAGGKLYIRTASHLYCIGQ